MTDFEYKKLWAYVIGLAIGDGNLSNPNGRAVKLRISCCTDYPNLILRVVSSLRAFLPKNKVSIIKRPSKCVDVYVHSNTLESLLGWKVGLGPKHKQNVGIPDWIKQDRRFVLACLKGLLETDGSSYTDRGYKMVNFVTIIPRLANEVMAIITELGFKPHLYLFKQRTSVKHTIRVSKDCDKFIELINFYKN